MQTFRDWLANQEESSAFTRLRADAARGLKPAIPAASIHSRSTASPFETEKLSKKSKKKKKKKDKCSCGGKCDDCKDKKKIDESRKRGVVKNNKIDDFLNAVGALKDDARNLEDAKAKRAKEKDRDARSNRTAKRKGCRQKDRMPNGKL